MINDVLNNLKVKCIDIVRNVYKTSFKDLNVNKEYENNVKNNNFFDITSIQIINLIESQELKKIENINSLKKNNNLKFNLSFSNIVKLSSFKI